MAAPDFAWMPMTAFTDRRLGARDLRVLGVLYGHAGSRRICWPAVGTIAALTGIDRRDVQRTIRRLEDFGWVRTEVGGGRASTTRYRLWMAAPPAEEKAGDASAGETPAESAQRAGDSPPEGRVNDHETAGEPPARTDQNMKEKPDPLSEPATAPDDFAAFWAAYPRRRGKADARKAWQALKPDAALVARILAAVTLARASPDWRREGGQFIPYPATWLRRRGWEDELETDIEPLPGDQADRHGEGRRVDGTLAALDSLFGGGQDDAEHHVPEGHGLPVGRVWH